MRVKLPNGDKVILDTTLPLDERKKVVDKILQEWNWFFEESWELSKTKNCLDTLSNYICLVKDGDKKNKEDKYIMSLTKLKHLNRWNDKKSTNFSDLPNEQQKLLGVVDNGREDESGEY